MLKRWIAIHALIKLHYQRSLAQYGVEVGCNCDVDVSHVELLDAVG